MTLRVAAEERQAVRQGAAVLARRQMRQQVEHDLRHGHPWTPSLDAVGGREAQPDLHDPSRRHTGCEQRMHCLGDDQREPLLETFDEPAFEPLDVVTGWPMRDLHVIALDRHVERNGIVGPQIKRGSR